MIGKSKYTYHNGAIAPIRSHSNFQTPLHYKKKISCNGLCEIANRDKWGTCVDVLFLFFLPDKRSFHSNFHFLFWTTKLQKYYVIVCLIFYHFSYFLNFCLACLALQNCKNGTHWNENLATYFWYFGSFDEKQSYENM